VHHAQNFTDIDDKIIARANEAGVPPSHLTESLIREWRDETAALNILPATVYPRATEELPGIIAMIEGLIAKGHAYQADGDAYFRVRSFPSYGKLSHRTLDDLLAGARIEVDERKDDPLDFALWKAAKPGEPAWASPFGEGRPGWHIECSAMCTTHLGGVVDIHGGGADLIFPHHENEIAQSEAFLGVVPFARYWLHNGLLRLDGEKMSKSLGNMVRLRDIIERGLETAFRLLVLQSHYRAPLTYTDEGLQAAERGLERLRVAARASDEGLLDHQTSGDPAELAREARNARERFVNAMNDDFDTPGAIAALFDLGRAINRHAAGGQDSPGLSEARDTLRELAGVLGIDLEEADQVDVMGAAPFIELLISVRESLRAGKQWAQADLIRDGLEERGISIEDGASRTTWRFDGPAGRRR
ncbi:MAG TPA: cysteine--tRNA ligase, partial [Thermomicrobiales bacterium]|nr:cysteine--tRNA ligase [Thermomicrobiales bacterium]